jgi:PKD repeat protein
MFRSLVATLCLAWLTLSSSPVGTAAQDQNVRTEQKLGPSAGGFMGSISENARFGVDVALIGDLENDGFPEVAVGVHREDDGGKDRGAVWIFSLFPDGTVRSQRKISSVFGGFSGPLEDGDRFGVALEGIGDLDGDGIEDLAVGAYRDDDGGMNVGAVWLLFLNSDATVRGHQKISATAGGFTGLLDDNDSFGWAIQTLGDLDGDGVSELAVAASRDDDGNIDSGAVWILFLNPNGTVKSQSKLSSSSGGALSSLERRGRFGGDICALDDLDGDGVDELVVGAFGDEADQTGEVWILFLRNDASFKDAVRIGASAGGFTGALEASDRFGVSLCATDLDEDGIEDLVVGATGDDDGGGDRGALWILLLAGDGSVRSTHKISALTGGFGGELADGDEFGNATACLGDLDGDSVGDLLVGSFLDDTGGVNSGSVWVLFRAYRLPQPAADYSVDQRVGMAPHQAVFQDNSSGDVSAWSWDFGDGETSTLATPTHTFLFQGKYDAGLVVSGPSGSDELLRMGYIVVEAPPVAPTAAFEANPIQGLAPLDVNFIDRTVGEVTTWFWDFGDGTSSVLADPFHRYADIGSYWVSLWVDGPRGGDMTLLDEPVVVLEPPPVAMYSATPILGEAPLSVNFTDASSGTVTTRHWDFGDGTSSVEEHPLHVFDCAGTYTIRLDVTSGGGSDTYELPGLILVSAPAAGAAFSATPSQGPAPLSVVFGDKSTGGVQSWIWDFGDGNASTLQHPSHIYQNGGSYTATLQVATDAGGFSTSRNIVVVPALPQADFALAPNEGPAALFVSFEDRSTGVVTSWDWDFGDGAGSSVPDPVHVYGTPGVYDVTLRAGNSAGQDVRTQAGAVEVLEPLAAGFTQDVSMGSLPLQVSFQNTSTADATAWTWDFGDGTGSTLASPTHVYTVAGTYDVALSVQRGPDQDTHIEAGAITVLVPLVAGFTQDPVSGTAPLTVTFTDISSGGPSAWNWDFGDGTSATAVTTSHVFEVPGSYTIRLHVSRESDMSTALGTLLVFGTPPRADFAWTPQAGIAQLSVAFDDLSVGPVTSRQWDFGDGGTSTLASPVHDYVLPGTYAVSLTVASASGMDALLRDRAVVVEAAPALIADFQSDVTFGFEPLEVQFMDASSGGATSWSWSFGDGATSSLASPLHIYPLSGVYSVELTVGRGSESSSILRTDFIVVLPVPLIPGFEAAPRRGRMPLSVSFTDLTTGPVTEWTWDFGDGLTSSERHPTHTYLRPGLFSVRLTVRGGGGVGTVNWPELIRVLPPRLGPGVRPRWGGTVILGPVVAPGWPVGLRGDGGMGQPERTDRAPLDPSLIGIAFGL